MRRRSPTSSSGEGDTKIDDKMAGLSRTRSKRSVATKDVLIGAALEVLAEHGYESTSLEAIALRAGLTKATLYYHFDSKEAIYGAVLVKYLGEALARLESDVEQAISPSDAILRVIDGQFDDTLSPSKRYVHYQEIVRTSPEVRTLVREAQRRYETALAEVIRRGQESGDFMPGDPQILAMIIIGAIGRTARWFRPDARVSGDEFRQMVARLLMHGLVAGGDDEEGGAHTAT